MTWPTWTARRSAELRGAARWREVPDLDAPAPAGAVHTTAGGPLVSFASNDYLGLTRHPAVVAAGAEALDRWGTGAGSARLVAGARPVHRELEAALAAWKGTEAAVLFPTGYAANLGVLQALGGPDARIVSDRLNHASIVDGCRLSRSEVVVVPHLDVDAVEAAVAGAPGRALVVTESVFSMDGDVAPVADLVDVCARHGALLVLDEAHAVLGPEVAAAGGPVLRVGTLSKALASLGGFVAGPADLCALVVNRARSFVFTTASTPADTAAALAALGVVRSDEGRALVARLRANVERLRPGHPSPIVAVVIGDDGAAVAVAAELRSAGFLVPAIRPPTVPEGTARLRVSLSAVHTPAEVHGLARQLSSVNRHENQRVPPTTSRARGGPRVVAVLGTDTGVGKTWVAAALAGALRAAGVRVAARKPAQSFDPGEGPSDAEVLGAATGETPAAVCPPHRWYGRAMAPPMAAAALGLPPFSLSDLVGELAWPAGVVVGLVEGAGGPRSPLAAGADNVDLLRTLRPDAVVLVAPAGLGALNAVLLSVAALPPAPAPVVFLNRYAGDDPVHAANRAWLEKEAGLTVVTDVARLAGILRVVWSGDGP